MHREFDVDLDDLVLDSDYDDLFEEMFFDEDLDEDDVMEQHYHTREEDR